MISQGKGKGKGIPTPLWILRHHSPSSITSIDFATHSPFNSRSHQRSRRRKEKFVISSDSAGRISITSLNDYRPVAFWKAHGKSLESDGKGERRKDEDSPVLGVEILENGWILT